MRERKWKFSIYRSCERVKRLSLVELAFVYPTYRQIYLIGQVSHRRIRSIYAMVDSKVLWKKEREQGSKRERDGCIVD